MGEIRAQINQSLFQQAMEDSQQFEQRLEQFKLLKIDRNIKLVARQFNISQSPLDIEHKELWDLQTFGIAGQQRYVDTFIIEPNKHVSIYFASERERNFQEQRVQEIIELAKLPTQNGFRWSEPKYDIKRNSAYILLSYTLEPKNSLSRQVGFAINIGDVLNVSNVYAKDDINLIATRDDIIPVFGQADIDDTIKQELKQLVNSKIDALDMGDNYKFSQLDDYYVISKSIDGPNWRQISLIPKSKIKKLAYAPFYNELKYSLVCFGLMTIIMLIILRQSLAKPIRNFVSIINSDRQPTFERRLPESRKDELGDISRAYNMLIDTIKLSYDELESKVEQRTIELAHAKQAAEKATARKSEHLTNISHEIRTPLNGITGSLELLHNTQMTEYQADLINTAYTCAKSLLSIINNLLDFSRIEADQIELIISDNSLLKVVDEAMLTIQSYIVNKPIKLKTIVNANVPETCSFDPIRVRQILVNLLGNAAKFTHQGEIAMYIEVVDEKIHFSIKDTGPGIKKNEQKEVFEPFKQSSQHQVGTGLGLPISRKLANKMGGSLTLTSVLGKGATFTFCMPLHNPGMLLRLEPYPIKAPTFLHQQIQLWGGQCISQDVDSFRNEEFNYLPWRLWRRLYELQHGISSQKDHTHPKEMLPWKLKVLLVDDVEINRDIVSKMLIELDQEVTCTSNGETALQIGEKHIFDLVLMDIRMPVLDGYQTTKLWRESENILDKDCPIMALTANANPAEHEQLINLMGGYLTKPVSMKELAKALNSAAIIQIDRDMQPDINLESDTPIVDFNADGFTQRLTNHFKEMAHVARVSFTDKNWSKLRDILHDVKGSAGLAGATNIYDMANALDKQIEKGKQITNNKLYQLINALKKYSAS